MLRSVEDRNLLTTDAAFQILHLPCDSVDAPSSNSICRTKCRLPPLPTYTTDSGMPEFRAVPVQMVIPARNDASEMNLLGSRRRTPWKARARILATASRKMCGLALVLPPGSSAPACGYRGISPRTRLRHDHSASVSFLTARATCTIASTVAS